MELDSRWHRLLGDTRGVARDKLTIGLAAYGRAFGGVDGPSQQFDGLGSRADGVWRYSEIMEGIEGGNLVVTEDPDGAYAVAGDGESLETVFYLSAEDVAMRTQFAQDEGYRGVMLWEATMDISGEQSLTHALK